ncbi:MAG: hypothetical protein HY289_13730 [Planctomycetes bacterium]|nr:hypothetical protein [Planctomycetota bacterium]
MNRPIPCPGAVIAAAALLLVYGVILALEGGAIGGLAAMSFLKEPPAHREQRVVEEGLRPLKIVACSYFVWDGLTGIVLVAAGIGSLRLMRTARIAALLAAVCHAVKSIGFTTWITVLLFPALGQRGNEMAWIFVAPMWLGLVIGLVAALVFCALIVVLFCLPSARKAFADEFEPPLLPAYGRGGPNVFDELDH